MPAELWSKEIDLQFNLGLIAVAISIFNVALAVVIRGVIVPILMATFLTISLLLRLAVRADSKSSSGAAGVSTSMVFYFFGVMARHLDFRVSHPGSVNGVFAMADPST